MVHAWWKAYMQSLHIYCLLLMCCCWWCSKLSLLWNLVGQKWHVKRVNVVSFMACAISILLAALVLTLMCCLMCAVHSSFVLKDALHTLHSKRVWRCDIDFCACKMQCVSMLCGVKDVKCMNMRGAWCTRRPRSGVLVTEKYCTCIHC